MEKQNKRVLRPIGIVIAIAAIVALLCFVICSSLDLNHSWIALVYAIPADCIVMLSLRSAWKDFRWNQSLVSGIIWGGLLSIYLSLLLFARLNIWELFLLGIPGQIAVFLWFRLFRGTKEEKHG